MAERKREIEEAVAKSPAKKTKDDLGSIDVVSNWSEFTVKQVLNNKSNRKQIWIEGSFKDHEGTAIVMLEKKGFSEDPRSLNDFFNGETSLKRVFDNDTYHSYDCYPSRELSGLNTTVIYPATQKHLEKCTKREVHLVEETPELYKTVTIPKVIGQKFSTQWVDNILDHKAEVDRIVYEDLDEEKGFVVIPDLKWDGSVNTLNMLVISRVKVTCIRELNEQHLPLLRNIRDTGVAAVVKKYNVPLSRLRVYFHYLPSYYHLHVHISELSVEDAGVYTEKAHLLSNVINNIELMPDYYQKVTLTFAISNVDLVKDYRGPDAVEKSSRHVYL